MDDLPRHQGFAGGRRTGYWNDMSQQNVEIVREGYAALNRGDIEALIGLADPDVEYDVSRRTFDPRVYHGHDGVREGLSLMAEQWRTLRVEPRDFMVGGGDVVVPVQIIGVGKQSGVETRANAAHVWKVREGRIVRMTTFQTLDEALEAVGLSD
jgi:ketosteroid isomerase-like protein